MRLVLGDWNVCHIWMILLAIRCDLQQQVSSRSSAGFVMIDWLSVMPCGLRGDLRGISMSISAVCYFSWDCRWKHHTVFAKALYIKIMKSFTLLQISFPSTCFRPCGATGTKFGSDWRRMVTFPWRWPCPRSSSPCPVPSWASSPCPSSTRPGCQNTKLRSTPSTRGDR